MGQQSDNMQYKYKSYEEIEALKEQGWKLYLVSVKKGNSKEDFKRHMKCAKDLVIEMKGEIVEDVEIIDGFSVVFPTDAATTYKIHAIDHYTFFEQDRDISL